MKKKIIFLIVISLLVSTGIFYLPKWENSPLAAAISSFFQFGNKESETAKLLEEIKSELKRLQEEISLLEERVETEQGVRTEIESKYESEIASLAAEFDNLVKTVNNLEQETKTISQTKELKKESIKKEKEEKPESEINQEIILCQKKERDFPKRNKVIFNEIAWMGTEVSSSQEWIELKNISGKEINLAGWQILNKDAKIKIIFTARDRVSDSGFYLLERAGDDAVSGVKADLIYTGALKNSNEVLYLFDENCQLQDEVLANPNWQAGDNTSKRTMERGPDLTWQTSLNPNGTPKRENSTGYIETKIDATQSSNNQTSTNQPKPQLILSYPKTIPADKKIEVTLSVSNLKNETYDVKISILKISDEIEQKRTISEISLMDDKWQDSYRYLTKVFSENSFSGKFKLRVELEFFGQAEIIAKIRQSNNEKVVAEFKDKIEIQKAEIITQQTSQISPSTKSQPPQTTEVQPSQTGGQEEQSSQSSTSNLLSNPGFEEIADWSFKTKASRLNERAKSGSWSAKQSELITSYSREIKSATISVTPGKKYILGGWYYLKNSGSNFTPGDYTLFLRVQWNGTFKDQSPKKGFQSQVFDTWTYVEFKEIIAPSDAAFANVVITAKRNDNVGKEGITDVYWDDLVFIETKD